MFKQLLLLLLTATASIAATWLVARQPGVPPAAAAQAAERPDLEERLRQCEQQLGEQRQLLRKNALNGSSRSFDELFVLLPVKYPLGDWRPAETAFEDCWFWSLDGLRLHGWYCRHERPRAALLFLHGNSGNLSCRAPMMKLLHDRFGLSVLIFDYRGYGRSEGIPTVDGVLRDARAARHDLAQREGIADKDVVLMGESLGGAVAVDLAADGARALILENTFSSLREAAASLTSQALGALVPADKMDSAAKIQQYHGPLLQCHGDRDHTVAYSLGRKLFDAAHEPKTFVPLPGKDHNDPRPEEYYRAMEEFLERHLGR